MSEIKPYPRFVGLTDSFGTALNESELRQQNGHTGPIFHKVPTKVLHVGDVLRVDMQVDPSFGPDTYVVKWGIFGQPMLKGPSLMLPIEDRHVSPAFEVHVFVIANSDTHKYGDWDDFIVVTYRVEGTRSGA